VLTAAPAIARSSHSKDSSAEINRSDLLALMPQLSLIVSRASRSASRCEGVRSLGAWPAGRRRRPSGQLAVAGLRVLVAMAVDAVRAGRRALILEAAELLDVASLGRDEAAPAGQCLGLVEDLALLRVADRDLARRGRPWSRCP
jgi:hypothetical protein